MKLEVAASVLAAFGKGAAIDQPNHVAGETPFTTKPLMCYYSNWSQYRPGNGAFYPEDIPADLCTHLFFSFAYVEDTSNGWGLVPFEWNDQDESWMDGLYTRMNNLKRQNSSLKTLIAVGGWNHGNIPFSQMVSTDAGIRDFSRNSLRYAKEWGFDGVDLDWEYPAKCTIDCSPPGDADRFKVLYHQMRSDIDTNPEFQGMLLTTAVGIGFDKIYPTPDNESNPVASYDVRDLTNTFDYVNMMIYDMHGHWEDKTMHQAMAHPYKEDDRAEVASTNWEWILDNWKALGANPAKLSMGLGAYGRSFKLADRNNNGLLAPCAGPNDNGLYSGEEGEFTREPGYLAYYEVCDKLNNGWTEVYNEEIQAPYAHGDGDWVGYDNERSIRYKVNMAKEYGAGGVMFWAIDVDDFKGQYCGAGRYPLINAAKDEWNKAGSSPIPTTTTSSGPNTSRHTTTQQTPPENCVEGGNYVHSSNCEKYYVCVHGNLNENSCSPGLEFDPSINTCNWSSEVDCCNGARPCNSN